LLYTRNNPICESSSGMMASPIGTHSNQTFRSILFQVECAHWSSNWVVASALELNSPGLSNCVLYTRNNPICESSSGTMASPIGTHSNLAELYIASRMRTLVFELGCRKRSRIELSRTFELRVVHEKQSNLRIELGDDGFTYWNAFIPFGASYCQSNAHIGLGSPGSILAALALEARDAINRPRSLFHFDALS
jgi:hypothetical protein